MKTFNSKPANLKIFLPAIISLIRLMSPYSLFAQAPTVSYTTPQTYTAGGAYVTLNPTSTGVAAQAYSSASVAFGSGLSSPGGIAIDGSGNVFVADNVNNVVKKIPSAGGAGAIIGTGFSHPSDVKVDAAGNVYVADAGNNAIKEILASNGSTITLATGFNGPSAIALDPSGNIYVADTQNNQVKKVPAGGGTAVNLGFTFNKPNCVATDAAGDLYIIDFNYTLYRIPASGGAPVTWSSGFNVPKGITVGTSGDIYVADSGSGFIKRVPAAGGTAASLGPQLGVAAGVAIDAAGNVFVAYTGTSLAKIKPVGGYYLSASLPAGLSFAIGTGIITGTPATASAAKNYIITAYNSTGSAAATLNIQVVNAAVPTISYTTPQSYIVGTAIASLSPTSTGVANQGYNSTPVVVATGFNGPDGVAVDAAGNVYVGDLNNNAVKKIPAGGGSATSIGSGFVMPRGVAVDAANNVYVADWGNGAVKKINGGTGTPVVIGSGFSQPYGIAVDAASNVYVADNGNKNVVKIPSGTGTPVIIGSGFITPKGIAVDGSGNVYVGDGNASLVEKIPAAGGSPVIISSGLTGPYGVAVDGAGNLYVADNSNNTVSAIAAGSGFPTAIGSGFNFPAGVAIDGKGDVFVADGANNSVKKIIPAGGYYISPALPAGLTFNSATGVISGTPTIASVAKTYTITAYSSGGPASATLSIAVSLPALPTVSYSSPQTYFPGHAITPLAPSGSGVAAVAYSTSPLSLGSGYNGPQGVAVDASGNVYVADVSNNAIKKIPAGGGTPVVIGSGFSFPRDVAIDAAGNVFVTDFGNGLVKEIPGGTGAPVSIGSGFSLPWGIAIDAAGNLYVTDVSSNTLKEIPLVSGAYGTPVTLATGFNSPHGVALDAAGNAFVADANNNAVKKIAAVTMAVTTIGSGFGSVYGVRLDNAGNLYVTDKTYNVIKKVPAGTSTVDTIATGFNSPAGLALDGAGVIYVADYNNNLVKQFKPIGGYYISPALPAGLSFATTTGIISGTPTAATPAATYAVTGYNNTGGTRATLSIQVIDPSTNDNLSNLVVSAGTLTPVFASATTSYSLTVPSSVTTTTVTPTASDAAASLNVNGITVASGAASIVFGLQPGPNTFTVTDIAQDGTTFKEYTITITRTPSTNANLAGLSLSAGTLSPAFAAATTSYTASVTNPTTSITVTPTLSDATATVTVNGVSVASGSASGPISIGIGSNVITTVVTAQDGITTKTYTVTVTRPLSNVATLSALQLSAGTLSPAFASSTTSYTASVANSVATLTVTPTRTEPDATVTVNGATVHLGNSSGPIALTEGAQTLVTIVVTAQDGVATRTYTVNVTRAPSPSASLSALTLSNGTLTPVFAGGTTSYTAVVANGISSLTLTPTTADPAATVKVNGTTVISGNPSGSIPLAVGSNTITTVVTAADGTTTKTYTVTVTRVVPGNANLSALTISSGTLTPVFASATTSYTVSEPNSVGFVLVRPTASGAGATITVNGTTVASGTLSGQIPLSVGLNTISVVVTASDGVTVQTYTIKVVRAPSAVASLSALAVGAGTLTPAFATGTASYALAESTGTTSITIKPTATSATATVTVNGVVVPPGSLSGSIPLAVGLNNIQIVVTAQDGVTMQTYTIKATRAVPGNADLSSLTISNGTLSPVFAAATTSYAVSEPNSVATVLVRPTASDANATITVNGTAVASGSLSGQLPLSVGSNAISVVVTASDGVTTKTYSITATRAPSSVASLSALTISDGTLTPAFATGTMSYAASESNSTASITVKPTTTSTVATVKVNGTTVVSGSTSANVPLVAGPNTISIVVTAQDGVTTETYTLTVTRAAPPEADGFAPIAAGTGISVTQPTETPIIASDCIVVHQGVSPNGDGINDFLQIDNIGQYPDNKLSIMNRNGQLVYEAKGYDNSSKTFDGHSNKNGQMQLPGTYFYQLDYTVGGITKHKTGFIVLKY